MQDIISVHSIDDTMRGGKCSGCLGNIHVLQGMGDKHYKDSVSCHIGEVFRGPVIQGVLDYHI